MNEIRAPDPLTLDSKDEPAPPPPRRWLRAVWRFLRSPLANIVAPVIGILVLVFSVGIIRETLRDVAVVQPIAVPDPLSKQGYTSDVMARRLLAQIDLIRQRNAIVSSNGRPYLKPPLSFTSESGQLDVRLPGLDLPLRSVMSYLRNMVGNAEIQISGQIVQEGSASTLLLRVTLAAPPAVDIRVPGPEIGTVKDISKLDEMLSLAALRILKVVDPYALAIYYLDKEQAKAPAIIAYCENHDESCRPWATFLRALVHQGASGPGERERAIAAFKAAVDQLRAAPDAWMARGWAYEYLARGLEQAKGASGSSAADAKQNYQMALALFAHHGRPGLYPAGADPAGTFTGDAYDAFYVGHVLESGNLGSPLAKPSCAEAEKWYRRAAEGGEPHGQTNLGDLYSYLELKGCPDRPKADYDQAYKWYHQAADGGSVYAQRHLGEMYEKGLGLGAPEPDLAIDWYRKAAEGGDAKARLQLGEIFRLNSGGRERDLMIAYAWYQLATEAQGGPDLQKLAARGRDGAATGLSDQGVKKAVKLAQDWNFGMRSDL